MKDTFGFRLAEIQSRWSKATPGPWQWVGDYGKGLLRLLSKVGPGSIVMAFERWGSSFGIPLFRDRQADAMTRPAFVWDPNHTYRIIGITNPDAEALVRSWEDVDWLLATMKEVEPIFRYLVAMNPIQTPSGHLCCPVCWHEVPEQANDGKGHIDECPIPKMKHLLEGELS